MFKRLEDDEKVLTVKELVTSPDGIELIKRWEGCKLEAYLDIVGIPTIGYGHTAGVKLGDKITQSQADAMLAGELRPRERVLNEVLPGQLLQCQFDALISLIYNIGVGAFKKSTLLKVLKTNPNSADVHTQIMRWNKAGGKEIKGLTARRQEEVILYQGLWSVTEPKSQTLRRVDPKGKV